MHETDWLTQEAADAINELEAMVHEFIELVLHCLLDTSCLITHLQDEMVRIALKLVAEQVVVNHQEVHLQLFHVDTVLQMLSPCDQRRYQG